MYYRLLCYNETKYRNVLRVSNVDPIVLRRGRHTAFNIKSHESIGYSLVTLSYRHCILTTLHIISDYYTTRGLYFVLDNRTGRMTVPLFSALKYIFKLSYIYFKFINYRLFSLWRRYLIDIDSSLCSRSPKTFYAYFYL